ncbi:MAG TPA: chorismate mutase [Pyrinomonadaceae bacterium]|jgi:chorismate mutase|nr:chorismate mutase [Pyrinomonadaceae bacterium]
MSLRDLRIEIDGIDEQIVSLLHQRADIAHEVGMIKAKAGLPIVDREREGSIMRKIMVPRGSSIDTAVIARVYGEILLESRRIQRAAIQDAIREGETV